MAFHEMAFDEMAFNETAFHEMSGLGGFKVSEGTHINLVQNSPKLTFNEFTTASRNCFIGQCIL